MSHRGYSGGFLAHNSNWRWWAPACVMIAIVLLYTVYLFVLGGPWGFDTDVGLADTERTVRKCHWQPGDPDLYFLRTKMGVNYEAGHWFHMAENFMVQHSKLRQSGGLSNNSAVIYAFDKGGFIGELNGITRLMVMLGTKAPYTQTEVLYYTHLKTPPFSKKTRFGEGILVPIASFDEVQMVNLKTNMPSSEISSVSQEPSSTIHRFSQAHLLPHWSPSLRSMYRTSSSSISSSDVNASLIPLTTGSDTHASGTSSSIAGGASSSSSSSSSSTHSQPHSHSHSQQRGRVQQQCVRYMGRIGGEWPTVQRGHWFPHPGDIESFRQVLREACPRDAALLKQNAKKKKYKMVIYQRDLSRKLDNQEEAVKLLVSVLGERDWEISILMHKTSRSPCELTHILHNTDLLLTPHGFQSMLLLFLPRPALLFEIFPYKYYKRGYGPFGQEYGVFHGGVMSPPMTWHTRLFLKYIDTMQCMESKFCRNYARSQDVRLTQHGANRLAAFVKQHQVAVLDKVTGSSSISSSAPAPAAAAGASTGSTSGITSSSSSSSSSSAREYLYPMT